MDNADDGEIGAELGLISRGDEKHDDAGDEEHQQESADQLGEIGRKPTLLDDPSVLHTSSLLHSASSSISRTGWPRQSIPIRRTG
jgi:hypothetical protein